MGWLCIIKVLILFVAAFSMIGCASAISIPKKISEKDEKSLWIYIEEASSGSTFSEKTLYYCEYKDDKNPVCYEVKVEKKPVISSSKIKK